MSFTLIRNGNLLSSHFGRNIGTIWKCKFPFIGVNTVIIITLVAFRSLFFF